jgi:AraC family transcriptional regulator
MLEYLSQPDFDAEPAMEGGIGEARSFDADVLTKRTGSWTGGRGVLLDRQPRGKRTHFRHRLRRHTLALHLEGANTRAMLRYDGGPSVATGSTLGQVMLIPADHHLEGWSDFPCKIRHMLLLLEPGVIEARAPEDVGLDRLELSYRLDLADGIIANRMRALQIEFDNPGLMGRLYVESLSNEIAVRIVRAHAGSAGTSAPARGGLAPRRLRLVQEYIEANLSGEITLADLAAIAGVSNTHFCRAFHKSTGIASHQYVIRRRVERAKALLAEGELPIAQIALAAGFGNQSHMTTHFRRVVGTTPRRFRNEV